MCKNGTGDFVAPKETYTINFSKLGPINRKRFYIPKEMYTWKPDEEDIRGLMRTLNVTEKMIAEGLDIPVQRIRAAITEPRQGTHMPNPHAQSTRTLIMFYLNSMNSESWRK